MPTQSNLEERLSTVEKDTVHLQAYIEKLDASVEKLTAISADVTQLLAVHENRISVAERAQAQLEAKLEKRDDAIAEKFGRIYTRVDDIKTELKEHIAEVKVDVISEIATNTKKVSTLERWMWLCLGGGAVLLFAADNIGKIVTALN